MSWCRITLLAAALASTIGCGFRPIYAPPESPAGEADASSPSALATVRVANIPDRSGQQMRNRLTDLFGSDAVDAPERYRLQVKLKERSDSLDIRRSGLATRGTFHLTAEYTLIDDADGAEVLAGSARGVTTYNLLDEDFSTLTSIEDARTRVISQVAGDIRNRLALFFAAPRPPAAPS